MVDFSLHAMPPPPQSPPRLAFGPFEVNALLGATAQKSGARIRLSGQPFQILLSLLAHPGEVVTREQLREEVWSEGTFVDFDHSLSAAMNKLRRALSDSAENPRYIETIPGRGYRFIGALELPVRESVPMATDSPIRRRAPASGAGPRVGRLPCILVAWYRSEPGGDSASLGPGWTPGKVVRPHGRYRSFGFPCVVPWTAGWWLTLPTAAKTAKWIST